MMTVDTDDIFGTMRLSFLDRLDAKIDQIEQETEDVLRSDQKTDQPLTALYASLHKLIGSAGIYGLLDISDAAGAFIDWVRPLKANPSPLSASQRHQATTYLENLKETTAGHLV